MGIDSAFGIFMHNVFGNFDLMVFSFFGSFQNNVLNTIFNVLTGFGDKFFLVLVCLLALILLCFKRTRKEALVILISSCICLLAFVVLKNTLCRMRPYNTLQGNMDYFSWYIKAGSHHESVYCFPSAHATISMCLATVMFYIMKNKYNKKYAILIFIVPLIVGSTRIYFMVHYCTDIIAGFIVGFLSAILGFLIYYILNNIKIKYPNLSLLLDKLDLEQVYYRKHNKLISKKFVLVFTFVCLFVFVFAVAAYSFYRLNDPNKKCDHVENSYICLNESSKSVIDKKTGQVKNFCELHDK